MNTLKDILSLLLESNIESNDIFDLIISNNNSDEDLHDNKVGFLFEGLCIILQISKCLGFEYDEFMGGVLSNYYKITHINDLLTKSIQSGNNASDITIKYGDLISAFSIKYKKTITPKDTDILTLKATFDNLNISNYQIILIVKDKFNLLNYKYSKKTIDINVYKPILDKIIKNNLILDTHDIIDAITLFKQRFCNYSMNKFIEFINSSFLNNCKKYLKLKMHQKITIEKFKINENEKMHLISHKPRSGKSITLLSICKYLLEKGIKRILIMTAINQTIDNFKSDLEKYIDFQDINFVLQHKIKLLDENFTGIVFCSIQYLKINPNKKKKFLINSNFQVMIMDECHLGGNTQNTENNILNIDDNDNSLLNDIEKIRKNININIFSSGTSRKTQQYYKINNVYEWTQDDEGFMKQLYESNDTIEKNNIMSIMKIRHGQLFKEIYEDDRYIKDYNNMPSQVLIKFMLSEEIIKQITKYNKKYNKNLGFSFSSLLTLSKQNISSNHLNPKFVDKEELELSLTSSGVKLLKNVLNVIINNDENDDTSIMYNIEKTQKFYNSRIANILEPKLFIIYLPLLGNIDFLQKALKKFIEDNNLWNDYLVYYSNSNDTTGISYNDFITSILNNAKQKNKKGCVLLLGNKGCVGITYPDCDVTISLDNGMNLDNQIQRYARALTEAKNKTIGINIDMNIQRTYLYLNEIIHKHRRITKTTKTNGEILKYLHEQGIFFFNPLEYKHNTNTTILDFFNAHAKNILLELNDIDLLNNIVIVDDDIEDDEIHMNINYDSENYNAEQFEGLQKDVPKGKPKKIDLPFESPTKPDEPKTNDEDNKIRHSEENDKEKQKKILKEICKRILFPLLSILSRSFKNLNFKEILNEDITKELINDIFKEKKIIISNIMFKNVYNIIDTNEDIINNIREIYKNSPPDKIHKLISYHFKPSIEEKKENAEIPTPIELVEEMLNHIPNQFWCSINKVFEPCCGKGNFVMKIFEKFYEGLKTLYPDENKRCKIIIEKCLYFSDLTKLNIFITTEILKCEILHKTKNDNFKFKFNNYVGDTLKLDLNIEFDAIIGNPPYQESVNGVSKGGTNLYTKFMNYGINNLKQHGYLLFINPISWLGPSKNIQTGDDLLHNLFFKYDVLYFNINECKKYFKVGSSFCYYLIQKSKSLNFITTILSEYQKEKVISKIDLKKYSSFKFMPIHITIENLNLISEITKGNNTFNIERCRKLDTSTKFGKTHLSNTMTEKFKYLTYHTTTKTFYSDIKTDIYEHKKILLNMSGNLNPFYCKDCNVSESKFYIITNDEEADKILKLLNSEKIIKYLNLCKYSGFNSRPVLESIKF
jgi:hypothetical protein